MADELRKARWIACAALAGASLLGCSGGTGTGTGGATTTSSTTASTTTTSSETGGSGGTGGGTGGSVPLPPCENGVKGEAETDVDCGGGTCPACADEKACSKAEDCQSLSCASGKCAAATCTDQIQNQDESDMDCGGPCAGCADGKECFAASDCASKVCAAGHCGKASCIDGVKNAGETDIDCGGADCLPCGEGKSCGGSSDCISQVCSGNVCGGACDDGIQDGEETDVDCGGGTCLPCADKLACAVDSDCDSGVCAGSFCAPATCIDGALNHDETDVDCGGPCAPCLDGKTCAGDGDCYSQVCSGSVCATPACNDSTQNQNETDVDCGGSCAPCTSGKSCFFGKDCLSKICTAANVCATATCSDNTKNQNETDIDCGGACAACGDNKGCSIASDCVSKVCTGGSCTPATCTDAVKNQNETDIDCGGLCSQKCGINQSCAINADCAAGSCIAGKCNHPIVSLSASDQTCAVRANGVLKCWGRNNFGQLGLGDTQTRGDGPNEMGTNLPAVDVGTGRTVKSVAAGNNFTCAILDNNSVKCWGQNDEGQLGQGDMMTRGTSLAHMGDNLPAVSLGTGRTAVKIGAGQKHVCAILDNGSLKCWGKNDNGQLGLGSNVDKGSGPGQMGDNLPAVSLGTGRTAVALGLQWNDTCVLLDNATVKCWGPNYGVGTQPTHMGDNLVARNVGTGRTVVALAPGASHQCALLDNATVKCWGFNSDGRLGLGNTNAYNGSEGDSLPAVNLGTGRTAKAITSPVNSVCALLDNDTLKCWGLNSHGELGQGDTMSRGSLPSQMGDSLLPVPLGTGRKPLSVSGGFQNACAILDDLTLKCWGANGNGELGLGGGGDRGDAPNEMGDNLLITLF